VDGYQHLGQVALPAVSRIAWAQAYLSRPVRLIVPVGPAGATDITARLVGQWLSDRLGQQFIIENRPGAGTNIGTEVSGLFATSVQLVFVEHRPAFALGNWRSAQAACRLLGIPSDRQYP
jgi:hypothetical protein